MPNAECEYTGGVKSESDVETDIAASRPVFARCRFVCVEFLAALVQRRQGETPDQTQTSSDLYTSTVHI